MFPDLTKYNAPHPLNSLTAATFKLHPVGMDET